MAASKWRPAQLWASIFATLYDRMNAAAERGVLGEHRAAIVGQAHGVVVEIGAGTGANLPHYDAGRIERLLLTEPDPYMRRRLESKVGDAVPGLRGHAEVVDGSAERIDLPDAGADVVVSTLVLCSVDDVAASAAEVMRVLKPGGRLLFLEHVGSDKASIRSWQDRLTPIQRRVAGGCHLNRDTMAAIRAAGLEPEGIRRWEMPGATGRLLPIVEGSARKVS